ncbi:hypothetical protein ACU4GD_26635 [Cupriavidus basilensis]
MTWLSCLTPRAGKRRRGQCHVDRGRRDPRRQRRRRRPRAGTWRSISMPCSKRKRILLLQNGRPGGCAPDGRHAAAD